MSGGIKYRLSPRERTLVAEQLGTLESVRARLKGSGVDVKIQDPEVEVSVEEKGGEISYELTYPLDNDYYPGNGRIYLKDSYRLNRRDGSLISFNRSASQNVGTSSHRFWVDTARRDHPQEKLKGYAEHLEKFLNDLSQLQLDAQSPALKTMLAETLPGLHRPLPPNSKALFDENLEVFAPIRDVVQDLGLQMKFRNAQTGLTLRREGGKILLGLQLVLDSDSDPALDAENNGRMFLHDVYEIDAASGKVLKASRSFTPSKVGSPAFDKAAERLAALGPLDPNLPALAKLTAGWLQGLGAVEPPAPAGETNLAEPEDAYGKALWRLYQATAEAPKPVDYLVPRKDSKPLPSGAGLPADPERRQALHRSLAAMLSGDEAALQKETQARKDDPIFQALDHLFRQENHAAAQALAGFPRDDALARPIRELIDWQDRVQRLDQGLPLLQLAVQECLQRRNNEDRAWVRSLGRAFSGDSGVNPEMRRVAVEGFFRRLRVSLDQSRTGVDDAIQGLEGDGPFEKEVKALLRGDTGLRELAQLLDEKDWELRRDGLVHLAQRTLKDEGRMPATALAIAERYADSYPKAEALKNWLSGQGSFGQKLESTLGHFSHEVTNPFTLGTMMVAGGASKLGKLAFVQYFGNSSLGLKFGAEAFSVAVEAGVFTGSDKIYRSLFQSPVGVWNRAHLDFTGALLAFGVLRGGGIAGRRFQGRLRNSEAWQSWLQGRTRIGWAEKPLEFATGLSKAEGPAWKQQAGRALAYPLSYAAETGFSRAWLKPAADFAASHGLILTSLMAANSLSRFAGLRPGSAQGWKGDLVDDALLYGHFYLSGQLLQRMGPSRLDYHLAALESSGPRIGLRKTASTAESASETPAEPAKGFETPPQLRELSEGWAKIWQNLRRRKPESAEPASGTPAKRFNLKEWLQGWLRKKAAPPPAVPTEKTPLMLPAAPAASDRPSHPSWFETLPPPPVPKAGESFLIPKPLELPLRFVPGKAKVQVAVSWTGSHDDRLMLPVSKNIVNYECILGREEIQARPQPALVDLTFPSTATGMETQHAKISLQVKLRLNAIPDHKNVIQTLATPEKIVATLENMAKSSATFVNGKRVKSATLKNGDRVQFGKDGPSVIFHQDSPDRAPSLTQGIVPLSPERQSWTVGRESFKEGSPDIPFSMSSRDISRSQAKLIRDAEGNHYIQDLGQQPTRVNGKPVYGTQPLENGDVIVFGEGKAFVFRGPAKSDDRITPVFEDLEAHPRTKVPAPEQAEHHPALRDLKPEEVQRYFEMLLEQDRLPVDDVRAGILQAPNGRSLLLLTHHSGWTIGAEPNHPSTKRLYRESAETEANPFSIYLDQSGQFILKPLKPEANIFVQGRETPFWEKEAPSPTGPQLRVEGWVRLLGGERIFSGDQIHFDFMKFAPPRVSPEDLRSIANRPTEPPPSSPRPQAPAAGQPPLLGSGPIPLQLAKSLILQNEANAARLDIRSESEALSVAIPVDLGKIGRVTVFQEAGVWKIHSESGGEAPVLVNGISLPPNIRLPLKPNSELSIGSLRFKVQLP
ncbi:MAG TPA: FHA domain-containing protein [bacterium]|nr:FHA domain-containing protein [bacterium]